MCGLVVSLYPKVYEMIHKKVKRYYTFQQRKRHLKRYLRMKQCLDVEIKKPVRRPLRRRNNEVRYTYPFKNLAIAGGGAKAIAYCGVAKALERHGILWNIDRFAGTSAGAIVAALLCLGFECEEIEATLTHDLESLLKDGTGTSIRGFIGKVITALHFFWDYGIHPAEKFSKFIAQTFIDKGIHPDITFEQVFKKTGKELVIVVTDVNTMSEVCCSKDNSPNMPIREALRISMSIPVLFKPVKSCNIYHYSPAQDWSLYVDGGVLHNYPVHVFDEKCYLSTKYWRKTKLYLDSYKCNHDIETLGCTVYSMEECCTLRHQVIEAYYDPDRFYNPQHPADGKKSENVSKTTLYKNAQSRYKDKKENDESRKRARNDMCQFLQIFCGKEEREYSKTEFLEFFSKEQKHAENYFSRLYGLNANPAMIFEDIVKNGKTKITPSEFRKYVDDTWEFYINDIMPSSNYKVKDCINFMEEILVGLTNETMNIFFTKGDINRTIKINTGHISALDFEMELEDVEFLIEQGECSTNLFLEKFVSKYHMPQERP